MNLRESVRTRSSVLAPPLNYSPKEPNLARPSYPSEKPHYLHSVQKAYKPIHHVFKTLITLFYLQSLS